MGRLKVRALVCVSVIVLSTLAPNFMTQANSSVPSEFLDSQQTISLTLCSNVTDLDCIESFSVDSSGSTNYEPYTFIGNTTEFTYQESYGNSTTASTALFSNGQRTLGVRVDLESPKRRLFPIGDGRYATGSALRVYVDDLGNDFTSRVQVKIRTSFLKPQDIQLKAVNPAYLIEDISGGTRWTFSGAQTTISGYTPPPGTTDFPAWFREAYDSLNIANFTWPTMHFIVHHYIAGPNVTYFYNGCNNGLDQYSVEGFNAPAAGVPLWNSESNSININIAAAHLTMEGDLNRGFYFLELPHEFIICSYGEDARPLITAESVSATVLLPDGSTQPAVYQASNSNGILKMSISDFHYSRPTVSVAGVCKSPAKIVDKLKKCPTPTLKRGGKPQATPNYVFDPRVKALYSKYLKLN